jgi:hypothetical protein
MILIGSKFEVSSSLAIILHNASTVLRAQRILELGVHRMLIGREFVISGSFSFILHDARLMVKAERIM